MASGSKDELGATIEEVSAKLILQAGRHTLEEADAIDIQASTPRSGQGYPRESSLEHHDTSHVLEATRNAFYIRQAHDEQLRPHRR
jgi:hypothetical protein